MTVKLDKRLCAATRAASHVLPSSHSPSDKTTNILDFSELIFFAIAFPTPNESA